MSFVNVISTRPEKIGFMPGHPGRLNVLFDVSLIGKKIQVCFFAGFVLFLDVRIAYNHVKQYLSQHSLL